MKIRDERWLVLWINYSYPVFSIINCPLSEEFDYENKKNNDMKLQLIIATLLCLSGITLLFLGFWIPPQGEIDPSVLVAFGETSTFAGALFGVDYKYKRKIEN